MIRLDIFSDPICPWCYIGKALLDRALETRPDHPFVIAWHPFQLNPDMPREGVDRRSYLEAKFGGRERAVEIYAKVQAAAEAAGVGIDFERMERTPNTLDAHRLIHWAGIEGRQAAVVAALFRGYFREGLDIGNPEVLADLAAGCGMDRALTARLLASDADRDDILARDADARAKGVQAVPTFLVDGRYVVAGAQPVTLWQQAIDEIAAGEAKA
ncbi:DsbA family oxidoreductase [Cereibacter sphaeroides]|uniref:DsbA family oxidoreductase n=1 Tax=Cereibacter sphaeroides TaxID=1063 RepID=UPI001F3CC391|nr:DsbA family oxidoreductase [Cereibacter sphaeroides]MCE6952763.1 DsbA family oxidoreductase [Cereibacter sphaeroides]MCE6962138.1 DsbA family oxidoreductase [Cereibacter sphaeroides]MCE6970914.1 DsbA family oxidoreductase [Cereibacter sphaeroides]MCE6972131.1 DsbA family oxidoreductase [Cereibacter sphaeroides]